MTAKDIRPNYYKKCSGYGQIILLHCDFPNRLLLVDKECFEVINTLKLDFYLGNAFKYIWRLGEKGNFFTRKKLIIDDCTKAIWYLKQYILNTNEEGITPDTRYIRLLQSVRIFKDSKEENYDFT